MSKKIASNLQIKQYVIKIIIVIIVIVLVISPRLCTDYFDHFFLLEMRNPIFYDNCRMDNTYLGEVSEESLNRNDLDESLIISLGKYQSEYGFTLDVMENGAIIFDGINNGPEMAVQLSPKYFGLKNGDYVLKTQNAIDDFYVYIVGWTDSDTNERASRLTDKTYGGKFTADSHKYKNYWVGLKIKAGMKGEKYQILPSLENGNGTHKSIAINSDNSVEERRHRFGLIYMNRKAYDAMSDEDIMLLRNRIKYQNGGNEWFSIIFEDNTGIQFNVDQPKNAVFGNVNQFGVIQ